MPIYYWFPMTASATKTISRVKKDILAFQLTKDYLKGLGGQDTVEMIKVFNIKKKPVTDEEIGKHLKLKITEIRALLNRLHFHGIATYDRTRDMKTGWYTYKWDIKPKRIAELVVDNQTERLEKMSAKKSFEENYDFYGCKTLCQTYPFEVAAEHEFKCPECGNNMDILNGKKAANDAEKQISLMKSELEELKKIVE